MLKYTVTAEPMPKYAIYYATWDHTNSKRSRRVDHVAAIYESEIPQFLMTFTKNRFELYAINLI